MRGQAQRFGPDLVRDAVETIDLTSLVKTRHDRIRRHQPSPRGDPDHGVGLQGARLPDEQRLAGTGASWCARCDGAFFHDRDIAVVGGCDAALKEAMSLTRFARSATVIHGRDALRASTIMADQALTDDKLSFAWDSQVSHLHGHPKLTGTPSTTPQPARHATIRPPACSSPSGTSRAASW